MYRMVLWASALVLFYGAPLLACDICATHVALVGRETAGNTLVSSYQLHSKFNRPAGGGHAFESYTTQTAIAHWFTDRWAVQLGIPYVFRKLDDTSKSGLGDATLIGQYRAINKSGSVWLRRLDVYAGIKLPTGDSQLLAEEKAHATGQVHTHGYMAGGTMLLHEEEDHADDHDHAGGHAHGHHLTPGSGSWDGILGVKGLVKQGRWQAQAETQYSLRTEGDYDFRFGNEWIWRTGAHYHAWLAENQGLMMGVEFSGEWLGDNAVDGVRQGGSKTAAYAGPGAYFSYKSRLYLTAVYDLPIRNGNRSLNGAADRRARFNAAWSF